MDIAADIIKEVCAVQTIRGAIDTILLLAIVFYLTWIFWNRRSPLSPPGPRGIPLLGAITKIGKHPEHAMMKWNQQYGPVCMVRLGFKDVLVLGSYEAAHEALVKNTHIADRPPNGIPIFKSGQGIFMINSGSFHQEQRRFGLNTLREYGMGRRALEPTILIYVNDLCDRIEKYGSDPFAIDNEIYTVIASTISHIVCGHNVTEDSEDFRYILRRLNDKSKLNALSGILAFAPFLRHFPLFRMLYRRTLELQELIHSVLQNEIDEHEVTRDPKEPRDYIDSFLTEMEKPRNQTTKGPEEVSNDSACQENKNFPEKRDPNWKKYSSFSKEQLVAMCSDLFIAGTDTTTSTICWIILYLCQYPEVQRKFQEEVDRVLGSSGVLKMAHAEKMPYARAVIQEINRMRPNVPLSVPHYSSTDTSIMGYRIPKATTVLTNIWGIHHDETIWKNPYKFNPERHLDVHGNFVKSKKVMQFNIGLRSCLGQQLANMEQFLVTVSLFHRFSISLKPGEKADMAGESVVSLRPYSYNVVTKKRL